MTALVYVDHPVTLGERRHLHFLHFARTQKAVTHHDRWAGAYVLEVNIHATFID